MQLRKSTKAATQLSRQLANEAKVKQAERKQRRDERRRLQTIIDKLPPMTNPVAMANEVHDEHTVPDNSNELLDLSHPMPSQQQLVSATDVPFVKHDCTMLSDEGESTSVDFSFAADHYNDDVYVSWLEARCHYDPFSLACSLAIELDNSK